MSCLICNEFLYHHISTCGLISCISHINTISSPKLSLNYQNQTTTFHLFLLAQQILPSTTYICWANKSYYLFFHRLSLPEVDKIVRQCLCPHDDPPWRPPFPAAVLLIAATLPGGLPSRRRACSQVRPPTVLPLLSHQGTLLAPSASVPPLPPACCS